jgi:hypothetical protein
MELIEEYWDDDLYITDFDYGEGVYVVVMSSVIGWSGQTVLFGADFPRDGIKRNWDKGYSITNVMHDGSDWIVVMTQVGNQCQGQGYILKSSRADFMNDIQEAWDDGYIISQVCCDEGYDGNVYCAVFSMPFTPKGQSIRALTGSVSPSEIGNACDDDESVIDLYDMDGALMVATYSDPIYKRMSIARYADRDDLFSAIDKYDDLCLTVLAYYRGCWYAVFNGL